MHTVELQQAQAHLAQLIQETAAGNSVIIASRGKPVAVLSPYINGEEPKTQVAAADAGWKRVLDIMQAVPDEVFERIPADSSEQLDHYIYGSPKKPEA